MSVAVMDRVWRCSKARRGELLVLLAIADFANDDGEAWPSVETLAEKSRLSERETRYALRRLERSGELKTQRNKGPHGCHLYQIAISEARGAEIAGGQNLPGAVSDTRGAVSRTLGGQYPAPEPSENRHKNRHAPPTPSRDSVASEGECAADPDSPKRQTGVYSSLNGDQGAEGEKAGHAPPAKKRRHKPTTPVSAVVAAWNGADGLPQVRNLSQERKRKIAARLGDPFFREHYQAAILKIAASSFCRGSGKNGWKATFDFLLRPDTVTKAMEGAYDDRQQAAPESYL